MRSRLTKLAFTASLALASAYVFSYSSVDSPDLPPPDSSSSAEETLCVIGANCALVPLDACSAVGTQVSACPTVSSSSSVSAEQVLCMVGAACVSVTADICIAANGEKVNACQAGSSSSALEISSSSVGVVYDVVVEYNNELYPTVIIGSQTWFAKNLNYAVNGSKCYDNSLANCAIYGRLYDWATAMNIRSDYNSALYNASSKHRGICPEGWHLPTNAEWDVLYKYADSDYESDYDDIFGSSLIAGKLLKAKNGWNDGGNGQNTYGFAALPGGIGYSSGPFGYSGEGGDWWSASEYDAINAYYRFMSNNDDEAYWSKNTKGDLRSVRCIKD